MYVSNGVKSGYSMAYRRNETTKHCRNFMQTMEQECAEEAQKGYSEEEDIREHPLWTGGHVSQLQSKLLAQTNSTDAVKKVAHAEAGAFIGMTMIPEEGESTVYGMTAFLVESSTPDNPIVQIRWNLEGERTYYNVEVNKVNPKCATQLEMFALLSYTDKMGVTDGGTFGSFQKLSVYAMNAYENGYCEELSGVDNFFNKTFDWPEIIESVMQDYLDAQLKNQYEDCEKLLDYFEEDKAEDSHKYIQDKMIEILEKIEKGETETTYQIGSQSFTEDEWDKFLENFDSIQEVLKELMEERLEKKEEEALEKELEERKEVTEMEVVSFPESGISLHYNRNTGELECVDDMDSQPGRQVKWSKKISMEEYEKCHELFERSKGERTWEYTYEAYLGYEKFWEMFLYNEIDLVNVAHTDLLQRLREGKV